MSHQFEADAVEHDVPDITSAELLFSLKAPDWRATLRTLFDSHRQRFAETGPLNQRCEQVFIIATARVAVRHGSWGDDFHAYHNERHTRELLEHRIEPLLDQAGWDAIAADHWLLLWLFAACHDLRQREDPALGGKLIGANEGGSIAETWRILDSVGFDRQTDSAIYTTLRLMIAASTFTEAGSQARIIAETLQASEQQLELVLLATDVDTANVAEPMNRLARTAVRLIKETEYRAGRSELGRSSAAPVLAFLTAAQLHYFFKQQRFESVLGRKVFGPRKQRNQRAIEAVCEGLRQHYSDGLGGVTGGAIIDEFLDRAKQFS